MFSRLYWREIKLSDNAYEYKLNDFQLIPTVNCWRALVFYFIHCNEYLETRLSDDSGQRLSLQIVHMLKKIDTP